MSLSFLGRGLSEPAVAAKFSAPRVHAHAASDADRLPHRQRRGPGCAAKSSAFTFGAGVLLSCGRVGACRASRQRSGRRLVRRRAGKYVKKQKILSLYRGKVSYGTVDEDEFEEARKIRESFQQGLDGVSTDVAAKVEAAKRRLRERLESEGGQSGSGASSEGGDPDGDVDEEGDDEGDLLDAWGFEEGDSQEASAAKSVGGGTFVTQLPGEGFATSPRPRSTERGTDTSFEWPVQMPDIALNAAEALVTNDDARRRSSGSVLAGAAVTLTQAGEHMSATVLLQELREFGVERDVLNRRLTPQQAAVAYEEAALQLGLGFRRSGRKTSAWRTHVGACAKEVSPPAKAVRQDQVCALADVALALVGECQPGPLVDILQGAVDAEVVHRALDSDRRAELEISFALALESAGRSEESRKALEAVVASASAPPSRRQQAKWALMVHAAEVSPEANAEAAKDMRTVWDSTVQLPERGVASSRQGSTLPGQQKRSGVAGFGVGDLGPVAVLLVLALLALPLSVPLLAWVRSTEGA